MAKKGADSNKELMHHSSGSTLLFRPAGGNMIRELHTNLGIDVELE